MPSPNRHKQEDFKVAAGSISLERRTIKQQKVFSSLKYAQPLGKPIQPGFIRDRQNIVEAALVLSYTYSTEPGECCYLGKVWHFVND